MLVFLQTGQFQCSSQPGFGLAQPWMPQPPREWTSVWNINFCLSPSLPPSHTPFLFIKRTKLCKKYTQNPTVIICLFPCFLLWFMSPLTLTFVTLQVPYIPEIWFKNEIPSSLCSKPYNSFPLSQKIRPSPCRTLIILVDLVSISFLLVFCYFFLFKISIAKLHTERGRGWDSEKVREREFPCAGSLQMATQQPSWRHKFSFRCAAWVQWPMHFGHPAQPSQCIVMDLDRK